MAEHAAVASRSVLVICSGTPYGGPRLREALDVALAFAAFDQQVSLLFSGDGAFALLPGQDPDADRSVERLLGVLPDYGIERLWVDARSLEQRGIDHPVLQPAASPIDDADLAALIASHDVVLTV